MKSRNCGRTDNRGFVLLSLLVLSFILFSLLSLAMAANYRLHRQNRRMGEQLRIKAESLRIRQGDPSQ